MRRLSARIHTRLSIDQLTGKGINLLSTNAVVATLPSLTEIHAGIDLTTVSPAEQRLAARLEDDRAEVLARNHRSLALPRTAALLEREDAFGSADEQFIFRYLTFGERLTSGRYAY